MTTQATTPPEEEEFSPAPAMYEHCRRTYQEMLAQSRSIIDTAPDEGSDESTHIVVYEGFLTHLVTQKLNLSVPYYTSIRRNLVRMGCIRQLKRGGGSSPSQWEMIYEPTEDAFMRTQPPKSTKPSKDEQVQEQIRNLSARVSELEEWKEAIMESLIERFGMEEKDASE